MILHGLLEPLDPENYSVDEFIDHCDTYVYDMLIKTLYELVCCKPDYLHEAIWLLEEIKEALPLWYAKKIQVLECGHKIKWLGKHFLEYREIITSIIHFLDWLSIGLSPFHEEGNSVLDKKIAKTVNSLSC